jgi:hypothetical protein
MKTCGTPRNELGRLITDFPSEQTPSKTKEKTPSEDQQTDQELALLRFTFLLDFSK